jgi:hypothetical protein
MRGMTRGVFSGASSRLLGTELDADIGIGTQVLVPGRMLGRASHGCDDVGLAAVEERHHRHSAWLAGLVPHRGQQENLSAPHGGAEATSRRPIEPDVALDEQLQERVHVAGPILAA